MTAPALVAENANAGLKVVNLRKSYKNRLIIRDVTLDLALGEVVGLLGPNGSGKTTSFYAIAGLILPEAGQVIIDGQDVTDLPMYRRARLGIGYLPQEMSIFRAPMWIGVISKCRMNCPLHIVIGRAWPNITTSLSARSPMKEGLGPMSNLSPKPRLLLGVSPFGMASKSRAARMARVRSKNFRANISIRRAGKVFVGI